MSKTRASHIHASRRSNLTGLTHSASPQSRRSQLASELGGQARRQGRIKVSLPQLKCLQEKDTAE